MEDYKPKDKAGRDFWEDAWEKVPEGSYRGLERFMATQRKFNRLLRRYLTGGGGRVLELGCARGKYLVNFAREFGYEPWGIDYSESGAAMTRDNLRRAGVAGTVVCQDLFKTDLPENSFDMVYSLGLIEHFDNPGAAIDAHVRLLKEGGTLLITVPNLRHSISAVLYKLTRRGRELLAKHNPEIMDRDVIRRLAQERGIEVLKVDYFGPLDLSGAIGGLRFRPALFLAHLFNQALSYATFWLPASARLSPYLLFIGRKTAA
jgi:cyclopropane fatty-acyl-phospholipid synthase-like methyltransferase